MGRTQPRIDRRHWLRMASGAALGIGQAPAWLGAQTADPSDGKLPVAAVVTVYQPNSHADVIVGKILEGFEQDGGPGPALKLASLYTDQVPSRDMSRGLAKKYGFPIVRTIDEALTLGTNRLQVAGVLNIGEHGDYPFTPDTHQHMYPRRRFLDEVLATFDRCGQVVPVFNDKHLAYSWADARHMYDAVRRRQVPFLAGSSVPVAWREPPVVLPQDSPIREALVVGYGGLEAYGFHALEALQCLVERRQGGETGVVSVQAVQGDQIWSALHDGRWSEELLTAAVGTLPNASTESIRDRMKPDSAFFLIEYRSGLRATVAMINGIVEQFAAALRLEGEATPIATWCRLQDGKPYGHFAYLVRAIDHLVRTRQAPYPVERTLLTTGILDAAQHSLARQGERRATPYLDIAYRPTDWPFANQPGRS
ncbi:MAG: hypothetical protein AB7F89_01620 [Pirellulaceae bacterium]